MEKAFINQIKSSCKIGFRGKEQKECRNTMECNFDKCQKEQKELIASRLTDEDRKICENKDWKKHLACLEGITKKRGILDKLANASHCEVKKCPEISKLNGKRIKNLIASSKSKKSKKFNKFEDIEACSKTHCSKEYDTLEKQREELTETYNCCFKKFNKWKAQQKCMVPYNKKSTITLKNLNKCNIKYCKGQIDALQDK